jgi:hypothetical protein
MPTLQESITNTPSQVSSDYEYQGTQEWPQVIEFESTHQLEASE